MICYDIDTEKEITRITAITAIVFKYVGSQ